MTGTGPPSFAHVSVLTDGYGTYEHAEHATPRREHGYCADDVARVLLVAARAPHPSATVQDLTRGALRFLDGALVPDGRCRNRRSADGRWQATAGVEDCWGRCLWGLGVATAADDHPDLAAGALVLFERACQRRSPWSRSMAFAALGAAAVLAARPGHRPALDLLGDAAAAMAPPGTDRRWPWPEPRLHYANALLPDAMIAAGTALDRPALVDDGLALLGWLLDRETRDGHLSVTPAGGAGPGDRGPRFDQQPIEVATMAEACARAARATTASSWAAAVHLASAWFDGTNDVGVPVWDPRTGGGYDGLEARGVNQNQGAESTLALISTRQQALLFETVPR